MKFKDQLKFIRRNMKKNRLRVFMTILATTVACAFLIVLASVGFGLQKSMTDQLMREQIVTKIDVMGKDGQGDKPVQKKDLQEFEKRGDVAAVIERTKVMVPVEAKFGNRTNGQIGYITLTDMAAEQKANIKLDRGRVAKSPNEIVVGYHFGNQLWTKKEAKDFEKQQENNPDDVKQPKGYEKDILGKTIELKIAKLDEKTGEKGKEKTYDFKIVGVMEKPSYDWVRDSSVYVSNDMQKGITDFLKADKDSGDIEKELTVYADNFEHVDQLTKDLEDKGFYVDSVTKRLDSINLFFTAFKIGLIFVGVIAILISAIGIFNTMTMAVTERTQEIGIMKAIGASPNVIRKMFLMESAYIGFIGSVVGIIISYGVSFLVNKILPVILSSVSQGEGTAQEFSITFSYIPVSLVIIASVISMGVAILSGLNPAVKATRTNVLTALRREL
ncbi:FtsX-like permease family protein [Bacillus sonorensis]|uniref:Acetoin ABC transporter substrate-binding lipoprotein YtrF n=2 Tax=Bacillus sonorensis TaxID=119858 RepID=M5P9K2_9BACI|nr:MULTISPECIES: ABC transporter permease [Bacillus]EME76681.1 acetoin ABC transporter substrate-binding lipoprotein YtrF [Bacillus sonorensis L12]MCZ0071234.1 FtsX-like permease family protein [Bacillus sonorensis]MCZ0089855.1 FtsX-like permease family protein [Bacillus sonorensis]MDR4959493.1 FtsX-like permease family protein [Bacillus sonorensis]MEC0342260.1 FtsX-like permease family protein [Bacillus sonorensis]